MDEKCNAPASPTNTMRLRSHLTANGLAVALLSAWEETEPADVQSRLMTALNNFYFPEKTSNAQGEAK